MNITVTHTIDPTIVGLLQAFIGNMGGQTAPKANGKVKQMPAAPTKEGEIAADVSTPSSQTTDVKTITLSEVRALVQTKSTEGKKENIRALLADFGVPNVTALKADQYSSFYEKVQAL